jgi:hypothetical protein
MHTQTGLDNLWADAKAGQFLFCSDVQIVCDNTNERCLRVYLYTEQIVVYFSSKRSSGHEDDDFETWIRSSEWHSSVSNQRRSADNMAQHGFASRAA